MITVKQTLDAMSSHLYLKQLVLSYLALGLTDTLHHLHVFFALGQQSAMHAVITGVLLIPVSLFSIVLFVHYKSRSGLTLHLAITALAIAIPGYYHGGWDHLLKIVAFMRVEGETTKLSSLFPQHNLHLWFYEISGVLEFFLAILCTYFAWKYLTHRAKHYHLLEVRSTNMP